MKWKVSATHGTDRWRPKLQNKWRFRSSSRRCTCTFQRGRNRLSQSPGRDVERPADVEPCVTFQQHAPSLSFITCVQRRITKVQRYNLGSDCLVEKTFKIWRANFRFKNQKKRVLKIDSGAREVRNANLSTKRFMEHLTSPSSWIVQEMKSSWNTGTSK